MRGHAAARVRAARQRPQHLSIFFSRFLFPVLLSTSVSACQYQYNLISIISEITKLYYHYPGLIAVDGEVTAALDMDALVDEAVADVATDGGFSGFGSSSGSGSGAFSGFSFGSSSAGAGGLGSSGSRLVGCQHKSHRLWCRSYAAIGINAAANLSQHQGPLIYSMK